MVPRPAVLLMSFCAVLCASIAMSGAGHAVPTQTGNVNAASSRGSDDKDQHESANWRRYESGKFYGDTPGSAPEPRPFDHLGPVIQENIVPGLVHSQYDDGVVQADVLQADLTESTLSVGYISPENVADPEPVSVQARRSGAVAATNGDNFDINDSEAPRGAGILDGELRHAPAEGWNEGVVISQQQDGDVGRLADILLDAVATLPSGDSVALSNLNSPNVATDGVGIYSPEWGSTQRSRTVDGAESVREVQIEQGAVTAVRTEAGADPVPDDGLVLLGRDGGATELDDLQTGDQVEIEYRADYEGAEAHTGITGNTTLLRDGEVVAPGDEQHPRTGVGFSEDGRTMWLVALDGRSDDSTGMTLIEFAEFLGTLGAHDAVNLDGGGSTTMVAMMPGDTELSVQNRPSDGAQRPVSNALGFTSTAYPPDCVRVSLDSQAYEPIGEGDSGDLVLATECLMKAAGHFDSSPDSTFDAETGAAVEAFQGDRELPVNGKVDTPTWTALLSAGETPTLQEGSTGLAVKRVQRALNAAVEAGLPMDGVFAADTEEAVRAYQESRELGVDGIVGSDTWDALQHGR